ncbi:hypothetical protein UFOVP233_50 [uncultured Caudovirales phage]|uniref:Uncharacterized protein n=1 Tax=uncultured Caudovirales phage TaxID=2100421 RepID=A0A6J7WW24_9CAUD|nr:hypothetical protein UFOVP233_50 [uncultured Caudovirales phage]
MLIWEEIKGGKVRQACAAPDVATARDMLKHLAAGWAATKPGRSAELDGLHLTLRFSDGKLASLFVIDPMPTAANEPDGQPRRTAATTKKKE